MEKREQDLINRLNAFEYDPDKNGLEVYEGELDTAVEISISLLSEFIDQELSKAREEGRRETLEEVLGEMRELEYSRSKGLRNVVDIEEVYKKVENRMIKLDKLKQ